MKTISALREPTHSGFRWCCAIPAFTVVTADRAVEEVAVEEVAAGVAASSLQRPQVQRSRLRLTLFDLCEIVYFAKLKSVSPSFKRSIGITTASVLRSVR
jgi:hypothetical protein